MAEPILDRRSLGLKFLLVCFLAVFMSIPAFAVFAVLRDRTTLAQGVVQEVGDRSGGEQTLIGPVLVAPYRAVVAATDNDGKPTQQIVNGWYVVFPSTGSGAASVETKEPRTRSNLFKVRTYETDVDFRAAFDLAQEPSNAPPGAEIDWSRAALLIGVTDLRGVTAAPGIQVEGGQLLSLKPGTAYENVFPNLLAVPGATDRQSGFEGGLGPRNMKWLVADAGELAAPGRSFSLTTQLKVTGVESFSFIPFARATELSISGNWKHVGYFGAFPAEADEAAAGGFAARWSIPFVRRGLGDAGPSAEVGAIGALAVTTRFVDPGNPYRAVERSLRYALLFVGVVFLAYFLFEATSDQRVHPAQYVLVGLAQVIFYLLLLAIAEQIGFSFAFLIAAAATVALIGWYAGAVFKSRQRQFAATAAFALLYALIYVLMTLEDFALLVGAVAAFVAIAAVMWFTRNLDWYGLGLPGGSPRARDPAAVPPS